MIDPHTCTVSAQGGQQIFAYQAQVTVIFCALLERIVYCEKTLYCKNKVLYITIVTWKCIFMQSISRLKILHSEVEWIPTIFSEHPVVIHISTRQPLENTEN